MKLNCIANLIHEDEGATMVEYAIMVGFIAAVCIGIVAILGRMLAFFNAAFRPF